jgi:hypothetical protein
MRRELNTRRNLVEFEFSPGHAHHTAWLDPELPATFEVLKEVLAGVAALFRGPYLHIGGGIRSRAEGDKRTDRHRTSNGPGSGLRPRTAEFGGRGRRLRPF